MNKPSHEEISRLAHRIWQDASGSSDADTNWLDAERQLHLRAAKTESDPADTAQAASTPLGEAKSPLVRTERAALQRKEARQPQMPTHTGPKTAPPESGKPLWNQPHSS